jgi:hypothetical protein
MRFFLVDGVDFDGDLIVIFVKDLIGYRIGKFIFLKDRDWSVK